MNQGEGGSPVSLDSALALFRSGLTPVEQLQNGESTADRLIARFVGSLERSDTNTLRALVMSRSEFAYLYYPTSPFTRHPSRQEPGLAWFLHLQQSQKGVTRLLNRYGGRPLGLIRNECKAPRHDARNGLWQDCVQWLVRDGDTVKTRLFAGLIERDRRFKIFSYSNDL